MVTAQLHPHTAHRPPSSATARALTRCCVALRCALLLLLLLLLSLHRKGPPKGNAKARFTPNEAIKKDTQRQLQKEQKA